VSEPIAPTQLDRVHEPQVWLSRDLLAEEGPDFCSFVVGIADAPDWGIHAFDRARNSRRAVMGLLRWLFSGGKHWKRPGTDREMTELFRAVAFDCVDKRSLYNDRSLKELLALGFDINAPAPYCNEGKTYVIQHSVGIGDQSLHITKILVKHGADLHRLYDGKTLLEGILDPAYSRHEETKNYLRSMGVPESSPATGRDAVAPANEQSDRDHQLATERADKEREMKAAEERRKRDDEERRKKLEQEFKQVRTESPDEAVESLFGKVAAQQLYDQGLRQFCKSQANRTMLWYPEASRTLTKAIEADPGFLPAYRVRLKCYQALGRTDEAAQEARAIENLESVSPPPRPDRFASQAFHDRGVSCMEPGGLIEDALYYLWKAIDADPEFADAYDARSDVYSTLGMADEALADMKRMTEYHRK
jgi:tetratricopeptide (TPR) repeat protein